MDRAVSGREAVRLANLAGVLGEALAAWAARDDPAAGPGARRAASEAVAVADDMLAALHKIRQQLVSEARRFDDAALARADALLARREAEGR